jgi:hypothetical protein
LLAPGASKLIPFPKTINGNITNNVVVTANPCLSTGADISGAQDVTATDPSEVAEAPPHDGDTKSGDKNPYSPPGGPQGCIHDKWKAAGKTDELVCATKEVYLDSLASDKPLKCSQGEPITITINATLRIAGPRRDLGWYVATDGGDALDGQCVVNGLQKGNAYPIMDIDKGTKSVGSVAWGTDQKADGDQCGDVFVESASGAHMLTPFVVSTTLPCTDDNEDGVLDLAVCFTWRTDANNGACTLSDNIPGAPTGGCFCTRYDVPNVEVETPPGDVIAPC